MTTLTFAALALLSLVAPQAEAPAPVVIGELGAELDAFLARLAGHGFAGVAAVVQLELAGELSLADPLEAFFEDVPPDKRGISLHQLLSHTAGFPAGGPAMRVTAERADYVRAVLATELSSPPGARFGYSNLGYGLLAAVVEIASGVDFESHLRASLFEPLGMSSTGALLPSWSEDAIPHGYADGEDLGTKLDRLRARGTGWKPLGDGGLSTTALDMAAWARALDEAALLPIEAIEAMTTRHAAMGPDASYGYGCGLSTGPSGWRRVGHTGSDDIFSAVWHWFPEQAAFVFVAGNDADAYVLETGDDLKRILAGQSVALAPAVAELGEEALALYAGTWKLADGGTLELEARDGALLVRSSDFDGAALVHPVRRDQVAHRRELATALAKAAEQAFAGEYGELRALLDPFAPPERFEAEHARMFEDWTKAHGAFTSARAVPGRNRFDEIALVLALTFEHGERRIEYSFGPREVGSVRILDAFPRRTVRPLSSELFVDHDARAAATFELRFRLDEAGRPIALLLGGEDGTERELAR